MALFADITGADQWSEVLDGTTITSSKTAQGVVQLSIWGDWSGTLSLQRQFDDEDGRPWRTTDTFDGPFEGNFLASDVSNFRIGFDVGAFTSGTAHVRMGV